MLFSEKMAVYYDSHTIPVNTLCARNEEFFNVTSCDVCHYHFTSKGYTSEPCANHTEVGFVDTEVGFVDTVLSMLLE
jgi:hypothetical protein